MGNKVEQPFTQNAFILDCITAELGVAHYLIYPESPEKNYFSKGWIALYGFDPILENDVLIAKKNNVLPEFLPIYEKGIALLKLTGDSTIKYQLQNKSSLTTLWITEKIQEKTDPNTNEKVWVGHIRNNTEEQAAFDSLQASEVKYRKLFENMDLGMVEVDLEEKIVFINKGFEKITGYSTADLKGQIASNVLLKKKESKIIMQNQHKIRRKGGESVYELIVQTKNGEDKLLVISGVPVYDIQGNIKGSVGIHWDVTEIRKIEKQLVEEKINKEKEILEARLQAEEEQRSKIGKDLHDGVGQMLAYIGLYLHVMKSKGEFSLEQMDEVEKSVRNTLEQVRMLSRTLAPPAIRDLGLRDAVRDLVASYGIIEKPKFNLKLYPQREDFNLTLEKKIVVFRVIQELLNNSFKYAEANNIFIDLHFIDDALILEYKDDGVGYDPLLITNGVGLHSMKSRVEFYQGSMQITTAPGEGFATIVSIAIEK
jgi:two-component system sensor histidine kinase UhpB